jgi:hypothetical protein
MFGFMELRREWTGVKWRAYTQRQASNALMRMASLGQRGMVFEGLEAAAEAWKGG